MKCFMIAAVSADGFIAKNPLLPSTAWTGAEDKKRFVELSKRAGVVVMGQKTWQTLGGRALKGRLNIVYSTERLPDMPPEVETTSKPPAELIAELASRGFSEVAICGGSMIYSLFMKSGVIDTIYLTIEPVVFGDGVRLFREDLDVKLKLLKSEQAPSGAMLMDYEVVK